MFQWRERMEKDSVCREETNHSSTCEQLCPHSGQVCKPASRPPLHRKKHWRLCGGCSDRTNEVCFPGWDETINCLMVINATLHVIWKLQNNDAPIVSPCRCLLFCVQWDTWCVQWHWWACQQVSNSRDRIYCISFNDSKCPTLVQTLPNQALPDLPSETQCTSGTWLVLTDSTVCTVHVCIYVLRVTESDVSVTTKCRHVQLHTR